MASRNFSPPSTSTVAKAVGWVTFLEVIRDKVLYNIIVCSVLLLGVGFFASRLTFIRPERVILDFGLSAVALSCAAIAIFTGAGLLIREFDRRTIYVALCHPISRFQFILGKFFGIGAVLLANWLLLSTAYLGILILSSDQGLAILTTTLFVALFLIFIQSILIASIAILFSTFSTTSLSVMMTVGLYLLGNNISQIRTVAARLQSHFGTLVLNTLATLLPNLEYFNLGSKVTYGLPVPWGAVGLSVLYGSFMVALLLVISGFLVQGREV
jgi:ABC-type transport system involved in multi-copper enzyme maturation permease subunit